MSLRSAMHGPPVAPPRRVDLALRWWAQQPPRMRGLLYALLLATAVIRCTGTEAALLDRWGGAGVMVWQAERTIVAGEQLRSAVSQVRLPPAAVPPDAIGAVPDGAVAVIPVFEGMIVVDGHLSPATLSAEVGDGRRLVHVPVDPVFQVQPGLRVDVWAAHPQPQLIAEDLTVQAVQTEGARQVALVLVDADQVADLTAAIVNSGVQLTVTGGR